MANQIRELCRARHNFRIQLAVYTMVPKSLRVQVAARTCCAVDRQEAAAVRSRRRAFVVLDERRRWPATLVLRRDLDP